MSDLIGSRPHLNSNRTDVEAMIMCVRCVRKGGFQVCEQRIAPCLLSITQKISKQL